MCNKLKTTILPPDRSEALVGTESCPRDVEVLVCCHKEDSYIRKDIIYNPIQVGSELAETDLGFLKDNIGDNISHKNREYCELTALYWMWKNLRDVKYVGMCHYRRYFSPKVTSQFVEDTLGKGGYDVIACREVAHPRKNKFELCYYISVENITLMADSLIKLHPDCYEALAYMTEYSNRWTPCNMFISSREWTDEYCQWLFPVLEDVEKRIAKSPYTRANRAIGYMGEFLLGVYLRYRKSKVKRVEMQSIIEEDGKVQVNIRQMSSIQRVLNILSFNIASAYTNVKIYVSRIFGKGNAYMLFLQQACVVGFKADGIDISSLIKATEEAKRKK